MSLAAPDVLAELEALRALTAQLQAELYAKNLYIEKLKAQLASLKRARFGRSSEKLDHLIEQLELAIADLEESEAHTDIERTAARPIASSPSAGATAKSSLGRKPLPAHLPCETIVHEPDCTCPNCGGSIFSTIGTDEREVLEYVPSHFKRVVHLRPKLSCRTCETIVQAPMPSLPIERGRPGPTSWLMYWSPSIAIIFPCIARVTSMRAKASISIAQRWPAGSGQWRLCFRS